jgi:hypothetical protein
MALSYVTGETVLSQLFAAAAIIAFSSSSSSSSSSNSTALYSSSLTFQASSDAGCRGGKERVQALCSINFDIAPEERASDHVIAAYR